MKMIVANIRRPGSVMMLEDADGGFSWWCGLCGARSVSRLLPSKNTYDGIRHIIKKRAGIHASNCPRIGG